MIFPKHPKRDQNLKFTPKARRREPLPFLYSSPPPPPPPSPGLNCNAITSHCDTSSTSLTSASQWQVGPARWSQQLLHANFRNVHTKGRIFMKEKELLLLLINYVRLFPEETNLNQGRLKIFSLYSTRPVYVPSFPLQISKIGLCKKLSPRKL